AVVCAMAANRHTAMTTDVADRHGDRWRVSQCEGCSRLTEHAVSGFDTVISGTQACHGGLHAGGEYFTVPVPYEVVTCNRGVIRIEQVYPGRPVTGSVAADRRAVVAG